MNIDGIEVTTGGKFDLQKVLDERTEYGPDDKKTLHVTPELFEVLKDEWDLEKTKALTDKQITKICNYYKNKFIVFAEEDEDEDITVYYMDCKRMEFDSKTYSFIVYSDMVYMVTPYEIYPVRGYRENDDTLKTTIPHKVNDVLIDYKNKEKNIEADIEDFLDLTFAVAEDLEVMYERNRKINSKVVNTIAKTERKKQKQNDN